MDYSRLTLSPTDSQSPATLLVTFSRVSLGGGLDFSTVIYTNQSSLFLSWDGKALTWQRWIIIYISGEGEALLYTHPLATLHPSERFHHVCTSSHAEKPDVFRRPRSRPDRSDSSEAFLSRGAAPESFRLNVKQVKSFVNLLCINKD